MKNSKVKPRDAVHLACAENAACDYFVTCDDVLIGAFNKTRRRHKVKVAAINPVEFIRREGMRYGQS
jgi:predicted nucleic acid-binding protein